MRSVPTKRAVYPASTRPGLDASGDRISRSSPLSAVNNSSWSGSPSRASRSPTFSTLLDSLGFAHRPARAGRLLFVQELPLHARDREVKRRPVVSRRRLRHVHPSARGVHFDLHFRLTVIVGEYDLRVMRAPHQLGNLFDQVLGVRAQVIVDLSVTGGNGDAHEGQPPCSAIIC